MDPFAEHIPITQWAEDDRPREKLISKGRYALSDAELIAILIGSGNAKESAVQLSQRILNTYNNNLNDLSRITVGELIKFKGIGEAKAVSIVAAMELARRRKEQTNHKRDKIIASRDVVSILRPILQDLPYEEFWALYLNRQHTVIRKELVSRGGVSGTVVDTKIILKHALESLSSSIIVCHNHPSGNIKPSSEDITLTKKLKEAAKLMDIHVIDHIIITDENHYSFADEGMI